MRPRVKKPTAAVLSERAAARKARRPTPSNTARYLATLLEARGNPDLILEYWLPKEERWVDIFIPSANVIIEFDGPVHALHAQRDLWLRSTLASHYNFRAVSYIEWDENPSLCADILAEWIINCRIEQGVAAKMLSHTKERKFS